MRTIPSPSSTYRTLPTRRRGTLRRGFTLIEAAMVTMLIGLGVIATLELLANGTMANTTSTDQTTAMHLAGNIREMQLRTPYANLFDLQQTYDPPVDALGNALADLDVQGWAQVVDVQSLDENWITLVVPDDPANRTSRVQVTITRNGTAVYTTHWMAASPY